VRVFIVVVLWAVLPLVYAADDYALADAKHLFDIVGKPGDSMSLPTDVAVNDNYIAVADGNKHRILMFDKRGTYLYAIGKKDLFNYPVGVALSKGDLIVADTGNHAVKIMGIHGDFKKNIPIMVDGKPDRPIDVALVDSGKGILVSCNNSQKIQVYSFQGKLLRSWGGKGEGEGKFRYPATVSSMEAGKNIIVDVLNARAQIFTNGGKFLKSVGSLGVVQGKLFRPKGVAVDARGRIYISDSYMDVVQVFDSQGSFNHVLGNSGAILRFSAPAGLAVHNQNLYVVEVLANKVSVYGLP